MEHKVCIECKKRFVITEFTWHVKAKNLRKPRCRKCDAAYRKCYYENNREQTRARNNRARAIRRKRVEAGKIIEPSSKLCIGCKKTRPIKEFRQCGTEKRRIARCRACDRLNRAEKYKNNKSYYAESNRKTQAKLRRIVMHHKSKPCMDCNKLYPPYVMDFDHVYGEKIDKVSRLVFFGSEKLILDEIAKCEVVCANCHRTRTHNRSRRK